MIEGKARSLAVTKLNQSMKPKETKGRRIKTTKKKQNHPRKKTRQK